VRHADCQGEVVRWDAFRLISFFSLSFRISSAADLSVYGIL
jgi:hypothetical protein